MVDGSTEYYKWFQFFPGLAQYVLGLQVQDNSVSPMRDAFSGMLVRKYDLNGDRRRLARSLNLSNILGRMSIDNGFYSNSWNAATADSDVPGFVYLLARGGTNYGGEDADSSDRVCNGETLAGGVVDLTPILTYTPPCHSYDMTQDLERQPRCPSPRTSSPPIFRGPIH